MAALSWPDWVRAFAAWLSEQGYRRHSIMIYGHRLARVGRFLLQSGLEPADLAVPATLQDYLAWRPEEKPGPSARSSIRCAISCWVKHARQIGLVPPTPRLDPEQRPLKTESWLESFAAWMKSRGYRRANIRLHLWHLCKMGELLRARGLSAESLTAPEFLRDYLDDWYRPNRPRPGIRIQIKAAWAHWLAYARATGSVPAAPSPTLAPEVEDYLRFCRSHRGLSDSSVGCYGKALTALTIFLDRNGAGLVGAPLALLDQFVAQGRTRDEVARLAGGVRGFLAYLFLTGRESEDRSGWLDSPRMYRNERLPRHLSDEQLQRALSRVDRSTLYGRRDWAVLCLLNTYGLRIGEVARLRIADLDWESGRLRVARSKTRTETLFPLTAAVEEALREYLAVRPEIACPEVFVTFRMPHRPIRSGCSLVGPSVRKYLLPVVGPPGRGAHALRHTLARRLRQDGVSLSLMRKILGHRCSNSTGRYLRIALEELREVAANYADFL